MFDLVLFQPEIPPNTGNIIRVCANTGTRLHLVRPLGFTLDDRQLRRAGLDYREFAEVRVHDNLTDCLQSLPGERAFYCSTRGSTGYSQPSFAEDDAFVFGPETRGLPPEILAGCKPENILRIPMLESSRSLNLSNAAAVVIFEAWRQVGFPGGV